MQNAPVGAACITLTLQLAATCFKTVIYWFLKGWTSQVILYTRGEIDMGREKFQHLRHCFVCISTLKLFNFYKKYIIILCLLFRMDRDKVNPFISPLPFSFSIFVHIITYIEHFFPLQGFYVNVTLSMFI